MPQFARQHGKAGYLPQPPVKSALAAKVIPRFRGITFLQPASPSLTPDKIKEATASIPALMPESNVR